MSQTLEDWLKSQKTVSVESQVSEVVVDVQHLAALDPVEFNGLMLGMESALVELGKVGPLNDLTFRIQNAGGMFREAALEAFHLVPELEEKYSSNSFTVTPTQIGMEAVDGMEIAKYGAIAAGAAALAVIIWKVVKWIRNLITGEEESTSEELGKSFDEKTDKVEKSYEKTKDDIEVVTETVKAASAQGKSAIKAHLEERYKPKEFTGKEVAVIRDAQRFAKYIDTGLAAAVKARDDVKAILKFQYDILGAVTGQSNVNKGDFNMDRQAAANLTERLKNTLNLGEVPLSSIGEGLEKLYATEAKLEPDWALYPTQIQQAIQPVMTGYTKQWGSYIKDIDQIEKDILEACKMVEDDFKQVKDTNPDHEGVSTLLNTINDQLKVMRDMVKACSTLLREASRFLEMLNQIVAKCTFNTLQLASAAAQVAGTDTGSDINKAILAEKTKSLKLKSEGLFSRLFGSKK